MKDKFIKMLLPAINDAETEPEIIEIADQLKSISIFETLSDIEYEEAIDLAIATIQVSIEKNYVIEDDKKHKPWFDNYYKELENATRWDRYKDYLLYDKNFPKKVITSMQESLFKMTDLLGDPNGDNFKRKGLIVGDVQSGKTANYIGLMNLATDANFKVMIVLTGTTNTLREQTQLRIEDGLGISNGNAGVNAIHNANYRFTDPVYLTSFEDDFKLSSKKNFQQSIEATNVPVVLVTKKNSTSLKNIYNWLVEYSKKSNADHIDSSLLLIDDEADFASVNTNDEKNPTSINREIRDILELFTKSSYVGFTATPYANIFINPKTDVEMFGQDLFPRDYIYVLGESSEYVGAQSIFSDDPDLAKNKKMLVRLNPDELESYLPLKHKKTQIFNNLSPSMQDAINLFLIANVIRDLRGSKNSHRSMLINISRFMNLHDQVKTVVSEYLDRIKKDIRINSKLPYEEALKIKTIASLKATFKKYYWNELDESISFEKIIFNMNDSIYNIKVGVVNSSSKEVDYIQNEKEGLRVIVIGGFALSRGLTLEGLLISYYYRNSVMYDSLLQMGRWFGYRNGYADLCRIFMTPKVINDFKFIALATQELKDDLAINSKRGLTPMQFGIKVRSGQVGLIITARNKMKSGEQITAKVDFSKDIIETTTVNISENNFNKKNIETIKQFIDDHRDKIVSKIYPSKRNKGYGIIDVDKSDVIEFIKEFIPEKISSKFDSELIIKWLRENQSDKLTKWDFAFVTNNNNNQCFNYGNGIQGSGSIRSVIKVSDNIENEGIYKNGNSRLGSPSDGAYGLSETQLLQVKNNSNGKGTISQREYFDQSINHKPIILIYSVIPKIDEKEQILPDPIPMISLGIPDLGIGKSKPVEYKVNKIYLDLEEPETEEE